MIKGTTPTFQWNLPFETDVIKSAEVVIEYGVTHQKEQLVKYLNDCVIEGNCLSVTLTQEETLKFPAPSYVSVQLRVLTKDGAALATDPARVSVSRLLKEGVLK